MTSSGNESLQVKPASGKPRCGKRCWMYWRHSCCRFGWYPVFVAPILTVACLLSLYSAGGCDFITVHVGFTPQPNLGWNESQASLGFWYYGDEDATHDFDYLPVYGGCEWYKDGFDQVFIEKDRTWKVARIMAMVAAGASTMAALLSWLYCLSPLPTKLLWPALFLPVTMIAFIAEGSKFLLFDIGVCRTSVWLPSGVNSLPQTAESCQLGESAYFSIAAGAFLLVGLLLVCLRVPHERELDPHYGFMDRELHGDDYDGDPHEDTDEHEEHSDEDPHNYEDFDDVMEEYNSPTASAARQQSYPTTTDIEGGKGGQQQQQQQQPGVLDALEPSEDSDDKMARQGSASTKGSVDSMSKPTADDEDEDGEANKPSESRWTTLANMEASQKQESSLGSRLLEKLVNDLNCTYQTSDKLQD